MNWDAGGMDRERKGEEEEGIFFSSVRSRAVMVEGWGGEGRGECRCMLGEMGDDILVCIYFFICFFVCVYFHLTSFISWLLYLTHGWMDGWMGALSGRRMISSYLISD